MGLASIIRGGIATIDAITKDLQPEVTHKVWVSQTNLGAATYKSIKRRALVDLTQRQIRQADGQLVASSGMVTFVQPIKVSVRDLIVLPNGTICPILNVGGFMDSSTGEGFFADVYIG